MVTAPQHGKGLVDPLNGRVKAHSKDNFNTPDKANATFDAATFDDTTDKPKRIDAAKTVEGIMKA